MIRAAGPDDHDLLPLISGEAAEAGIRDHLDDCLGCRLRLLRMEAEVESLRRNLGDRSTRPDPGAAAAPGQDAESPWDSDPDESPDPRPSTVPAPGSSKPRDADDPSGRPAALGKYLVVGLLDAGGQAEVYRVVHPALGKDLVLKLSKTAVADDAAGRDALVAEGKLLADLEHPNLVRIFDLDFHDGRPFLVMEYVRGRSLQQEAESRRPAPRRAASWVAQVARVAALAHRRGIVHQDIKPKNILIDESGAPRLIDFGLARWHHAWSDAPDRPGGGTLAYMAPEQARCEEHRIGACSDVFALGGVLYFLLTGLAPFRGRSKAEVWGRAGRCDFDRAALRSKAIPRRLERIGLKAMAAEPSDRYPTADALADDLERFVRRRRRLIAWGTAAALVPMIVAAWSLPPPAPTAPFRIEALRVELHRRHPPEDLGAIGAAVFSGRVDDDVRVHARLTAPAYCYLIALNPDGSPQLCVPADESTPPSRAEEVTFPPDPAGGFGLTDGVGLQGFVVVASVRPLPPYRVWRSRLGDLPWRATGADRGWRFDGREFVPLELRAEERGQIRKLMGLPASFAEACRALQSSPGMTSIQAIAFPVRPKSAGAPSPGRGHDRRDRVPSPG